MLEDLLEQEKRELQRQHMQQHQQLATTPNNNNNNNTRSPIFTQLINVIINMK